MTELKLVDVFNLQKVNTVDSEGLFSDFAHDHYQGVWRLIQLKYYMVKAGKDRMMHGPPPGWVGPPY